MAALLALVLYGPGPEHGGEHEVEAALAGIAVAPAAGANGATKGERAGLIAMSANASSSAAQPGRWEARY